MRHVASISFVKRLVGAVGDNHLMAYASGLAYGAIFALLPMLMLLVLLLGIFNAVNLVERAIRELSSVLPADVMALVAQQLRSVVHSGNHAAFGIGAVVSIIVAIWGASGAMRRIMEALNIVHQCDETRSRGRAIGVSMLMALGAIVFVGISLVVIVVGGGVAARVFNVVGLGSTATTVWAWLRWPILLVLTWLALALIYRFAPASRQSGGIATPGTFVATAAWIAFSAAFSWYVGSLGNFGAAWGAVAGIIVLLLYMQYASLILLSGALIDVLLRDEQRPTSKVRRILGAEVPS